MAIYDFTCDGCGTRFEELVRRPVDEDTLKCPECGSGDIHREIGAPSLMTGGGGGLSTDSLSGGCSPSSPFS